jgi:hypothetical protein
MTTTTLSIAKIREKISKSPLHNIPALFIINLRGGVKARDDLTNGDRFILDDVNWLRLQLYVQAGRKLPTDTLTIKVMFGDKIEEALGLVVTQASCFVHVYTRRLN